VLLFDGTHQSNRAIPLRLLLHLNRYAFLPQLLTQLVTSLLKERVGWQFVHQVAKWCEQLSKKTIVVDEGTVFEFEGTPCAHAVDVELGVVRELELGGDTAWHHRKVTMQSAAYAQPGHALIDSAFDSF
jgi:hypothetical protein